MLYRERGWEVVLQYAYQFSPETHLVKVISKQEEREYHVREEGQFYTDLNIIHLICIFDQQQVRSSIHYL